VPLCGTLAATAREFIARNGNLLAALELQKNVSQTGLEKIGPVVGAGEARQLSEYLANKLLHGVV